MASSRVHRNRSLPGERGMRWLQRWAPRVLRQHSNESLPVRFHRRRIYVLPTGRGYVFGLLLAVMVIGSMNFNNNMGLALSFLLGSMAMLSVFHGFQLFSGLTITQLDYAPVQAGNTGTLQLRFSLASDRATPTQIQATLGVQRVRAEATGPGDGLVSLPFDAPHRGWHHPGRIRLFTEFPLGLFHIWAYLDPADQALVYPQPEKQPPPLPAGSGGEDVRRNVAASEDFAGLREYQPGDAMRQIAWKASAGREHLLTREYRAPQGKTVWLRWNDAQAGAGHSEASISRLAGWIEQLPTGIPFGLELPGQTIQPDQGLVHRAACLRHLALLP